MISWHRNLLHISDLLWGEFTDRCWIPPLLNIQASGLWFETQWRSCDANMLNSEVIPPGKLILYYLVSLNFPMPTQSLTHWGRVTHICVVKLTIIGSDNDLSPGRRQAIIWTNAGILLIGPLGTNFIEIWIGIQTFSFKENALEDVVCEMASILSRPQCVK